MQIKKYICLVLIIFVFFSGLSAQIMDRNYLTHLHELQQQFINLKFGMFIHFNIPTYADQDWPDPDLSPEVFDPAKLDCDQWAKAAKSAHMTYGCLTTKHHSGFCIWDTKTTDYSVMHSPYKKDVVRQFVDAFRRNGLKVMLYYSILDTHRRLRPNHITSDDLKYIKTQLTELLTNYGPIDAIITDGWDAPWSRISYDDISFEEIYRLVKSLQPNCLLMDLNSAKYPSDALFYSDIKSYEQNAGQRISKGTNSLPALSCYPLQANWFWKTSFPATPVKDPQDLVNNDINPFNKAYCNFILNVAPNREGLIDDNALAALKKIGELWHDDGHYETLPKQQLPIISNNLAKNKFAEGSWSNDMNIMDFGNDDDFSTSWDSNAEVTHPWYEIDLGKRQAFNMIVLTEGSQRPVIKKYRIEYFSNHQWMPLLTGSDSSRTNIQTFPAVSGSKIRVLIDSFNSPPAIAEFGVYNQRM